MGGHLILLVEDNDDNAVICQTILEYCGWKVARVADGVRGLQLAAEMQPALVILDLSLPRISGWDVAERLRTDPVTAEIPILLWSAQASNADRTRAESLGCAGYLLKPSRALSVVQCVDRILGTHSASVGASTVREGDPQISANPFDASAVDSVTILEPSPRSSG